MNIITIRSSLKCLQSLQSKDYFFYQNVKKILSSPRLIATNQYSSWSAQINSIDRKTQRKYAYNHRIDSNVIVYINRNFTTTIKNSSQVALKPKSSDGKNKSKKSATKDETNNAQAKNENQSKVEEKSNENEKQTDSQTTATSSSTDDPVKTQPIETEKKLSLTAKFKKMYKEYWYVLVPVHLVTSAAWMGGFYYLSTSGVDIPSLLQSLNFSETIINSLRDSSMGHWAIAYMCYKIATPIRYTVTLGGTTVTIKYLSQWGYIRPVPSKEKLKQIYDDQKAKFQHKD